MPLHPAEEFRLLPQPLFDKVCLITLGVITAALTPAPFVGLMYYAYRTFHGS